MRASILAADIIVLLHLLFILFAATGGLLVLRWPRLAWLHLPCAGWGVLIEATGGICPLTPLELQLRLAGGDPGYSGSFIERYLVPLVYPPGLTRNLQIGLGTALLLFNLAVYAYAWRLRRVCRPVDNSTPNA